MQKLKRKLSLKLQKLSVSMYAYHVHYRNYSQTLKFQKRVHITGQHRPTMSTRRNDREQPKNRDRKGQETIPANSENQDLHKQTERTTTVRQIHTLIHSHLKQSLVKLKRRHKDLQLGANWIPGNFLQFHLTNSSAKCRSPQAKNKSSLVEQPASCKKNVRNSNFTCQSDTQDPPHGSPLLRIAIETKMIATKTVCWCPTLQPTPLHVPN